MKTTLLYLSSAILIGFGLSSCVMPDDPAFNTGYSSGGYGYGAPSRTYVSNSYYNDDDFYYYDGGASPYYGSRPYGSYSVGYSYYRGRSTCPICHHSPCSGHSGRPSSSHGNSSHNYSYGSSHHNDHDNDRDDHHSNSGPTLFRHLSADRNPGAPQGLHTKEWYKDNGYGMSRLSAVKKDDHDDDHHSGHKSSHHDDDDKHHKH